MIRGGAVYIMTNKFRGTLYVGVISDLKRRVWEHKTKTFPGSFTAKYGCNRMVYYRGFDGIEEAIAEEKRIKNGSRADKLKLIEMMNPGWNDLWVDIENWS